MTVFNGKLDMLYNEPNRITMSRMADESIDITVTSPPYKDEDGYTDRLIMLVAAELYRVHRSNTLCFVNFGHLAGDKRRFMRVAEIFEDAGWNLLDTVTWRKNHYRPIQGTRRLNNLSEFIHVLRKPWSISGYVLMLTKGRIPLLNRLGVGVPYVDPSNAKRFAGGRNLRCGGNVIDIPYETITSREEKRHNDRFPKGLVEWCVDVTGYNPEIGYDPFSGSGTALEVFKGRGIRYIGSEIKREHCRTAEQFGIVVGTLQSRS